jgi:hypothetical protein
MSNTNKQLPNIELCGDTRHRKCYVVDMEEFDRYIKEVIKYTLEQAAENGMTERIVNEQEDEYQEVVDKESILSLEEKIIKNLGL